MKGGLSAEGNLIQGHAMQKKSGKLATSADLEIDASANVSSNEPQCYSNRLVPSLPVCGLS
jgi:hypothetical protein